MKRILIFFNVLCTLTVGAQNIWVQQKDFGGLPRYNAASFSLDSGCYIGAGVVGSGTYAKDLWMWDWQSNTWSQKADIPGVGRYGAAGFAIGNRGYVTMGHNGSSIYTDLQEYNPVTNTWTAKASFPGTPRYTPASFSIGTKAYISCGTPGSPPYLDDCWEYDQTTDTWTQKTSLGMPRNHPAFFVVNGKGFVIGGHDNSYNYQNDVWMYDPVANTWTQKSNYAGDPVHAAVGFSIGNAGFVGTGKTGDSGGTPIFTNEFYEYVYATDSWISRAPYPASLSAACVGFGHNGKGYIGCGLLTNGTYSDAFWEYRPVTYGVEELTNSWAVYPNPVKDFVCVENIPPDFTFSLITLEGAVVALTSENTGSRTRIRLPGTLTPGTYILIVRRGSHSKGLKLVVQ